MPNRVLFFFATILLLGLHASAETFRVAAAISLKQVLSESAEKFTRETGHAVELSFASSGQIAGQIRSGAAIDLFISASGTQIRELTDSKKINAQSVAEIAGNALVVLVRSDAKLSLTTMADLKTVTGKIAVGEPKTVPAGEYAMQAVRGAGIEDDLTDRLVFTSNVRQAVDFVRRGEAVAAIAYATDVAQDEANHPAALRIALPIPGELHSPIRYTAAIVAGSAHVQRAGQFIEFLRTPAVQREWADRGFVSVAGGSTTQPAR